MTLESILEEIDINQREGIFEVPDRLRNDRSIKIWLNDFIPSREQVPLVIEGELYCVYSITQKLGLTVNEIIRKLITPGLLRFNERNSAINPINTLSLAQIFSWAYQKPIEEILLSSEYLESNQFKISNSPSQRVRKLCVAYEGVRWFENLRKHVHKVYKSPPKIYSWQRISRHNLMDLFLIGDGNATSLRRLTSKCFIIPKKRRFKRSSGNNFVDNFALAELIASLYRVERDNVYSNDSTYINHLSEEFLSNRLYPFIERKGINSNKEYTMNEASNDFDKSEKSLKSAAAKGSIHHVKTNPTRCLGVDIAIYIMKETPKRKFTLKEFYDLLGVDNLDLRKLLAKPSSHKTFSRHNYIFPTYDLVAERSRELLFSGWMPQQRVQISSQETQKPRLDITCKFGDEVVSISKTAIRHYLRSYKIPSFDEECRIHVESELNSSVLIEEGVYETRDLSFVIKDNIIQNMGLPRRMSNK